MRLLKYLFIIMRCAEFVIFMCTVEEQICKEIFKLQHYRQLGITTFKSEWSSFSLGVSDIPYSRKFSLDKNFANPSTLALQKYSLE